MLPPPSLPPGVVLYEYLGEEYPEVLGSILGALKAIVNVIGMTRMTPPIKELLPRLTPVLKNRHEKVGASLGGGGGRGAQGAAGYYFADVGCGDGAGPQAGCTGEGSVHDRCCVYSYVFQGGSGPCCGTAQRLGAWKTRSMVHSTCTVSLHVKAPRTGICCCACGPKWCRASIPQRSKALSRLMILPHGMNLSGS